MKPWQNIPIFDNKEKLISLPKEFIFINPHPYFKLGAPYKNLDNLWNLREGVVARLIKANEYLKSKNSGYKIIVYDCYRPIEVQKYMFLLAFKKECMKEGINFSKNSIELFPKILKKVEKFWAYPNYDMNSPPPHSTGAAIDISITDKSGNLVNMGSEIDEMDNTSIPDFYKDSQTKEGLDFHNKRMILNEGMTKFGFSQHPNEWWHFSYGDQLWAWKNKLSNAIYGRI